MPESDGPLWAAVSAFLADDDWPIQAHPETSLLETGFKGENGFWPCVVRVREAAQQVVFYSIGPIDAAPDLRPQLVEVLTRANLGLVGSCFEVDLDDGSFRCRSSLDLGGEAFAPGLLRAIVYVNVLTMDRYLPAVNAVLQFGASAEEAIAAVGG